MADSFYSFKSADKLTFTDNGMFQAVLHEPGVCAELVERLLGVKVKKVEYPELEKTIAPYYSSKGVRLDVYLKDTNKVIDVELQSQPQNALGKRTRYYQSMVDCDSLMKGDDYTKLKESYILFICKHDPFKDSNKRKFGLSRYTFRNVCDENNSVNLDDKCLKVVYNTAIAPFWQGNYPLALSRALSMQARIKRSATKKSAPSLSLYAPTILAKTNIRTAFLPPSKSLRSTKNSYWSMPL